MKFTIKSTVPATPEEVYNAWLDGEKHSAMTGGVAEVSDVLGERFSAWDEYISGVNLELEPGKRIVQSWRTVEFTDDEEDSRLEIILEENEGQTELTLTHSNLPVHGEQYNQGWKDNYFEPMRVFFGGRNE